MTRHWSINGRFLAQRLTGVQRYAREIVSALDAALSSGTPLARDLAIELLLPRDAIDDLPLTAIRTRRVGRQTGQVWEQFELPRHLAGGLISLGNVGPLLARRHILCLHDTTPQDCPESYSRLFRASHVLLQPRLGRSADRIMTVSRHAADRLVACGLCEARKVMIAPNGHEHTRRWIPGHSAATRAAAGPNTVVVIGTPAPHKNVGMLIRAASAMTRAGLRLALVGSSDLRIFQPDPASQQAPEEADIVRLGRVSDGELAALLGDSLCLAFPSRFEGFGLPVLEAMALGCPVVASDRAGLPALAGEAALYASPDRPEQWIKAFVALHQDAALRARMRDAGRLRAERFSWRHSAGRYLAAMAEVDGLSAEVEAAAVWQSNDNNEVGQPCS